MRSLSALVLLTLVMLSGCAAQDRDRQGPTSEAPLDSVFEKDDDALAAAKLAYSNYLRVSDAITSKDGSNGPTIADVASPEFAAKSEEGVRSLSDAHLHTEGASTFDSMTLQSTNVVAGGSAEVVVYVCTDVSAVRIVDSSGHDVTPVDRQDRLPLQVSFQSSQGAPDELIVKGSEVWSGQNTCG